MNGISITLDCSYNDDYFSISYVDIKLSDEKEKERVQKIVDEKAVEGSLVDLYGDELTDHFANLFQVDKDLINIDTNEIDLM